MNDASDIGFAPDAVPLDLAPMEAKRVDALPEGAQWPDGAGWQFEPKWDGFRCLAHRRGRDVALVSKSGKPLGRYFPEVAGLLGGLAQERFVLDGELVIAADGGFSFEALQARLHPAESRIRRLASETPASFILFDRMTDDAGLSLLDAPLVERRAALEAFHADQLREGLELTPYTRDRRLAQEWLERSGDVTDGAAVTDGVVAKRLDEPYRSGERAMLKVKRVRTADCVVGGFRYGEGSALLASLLLGLYDEGGRLDHVGFTSDLSRQDLPALTAELEALIEPPGFTGDAPGGPSRWSTERTGAWQPLRPERVVEVRFDHVTGNRIRHGTKFVRWRPDKAPAQCTFEQLA